MTKSYISAIIIVRKEGGKSYVDHRYRTETNLSKYLILSATEDVYITRNGKVISKLTNPFRERVDIAKSLFGILPDDVTEEEARDERLGKI